MSEKSRVKTLIQEAKLDAEFRENCGNQWDDILNKMSEVPSFYMENEVAYQTAVFNYVSKSSTDISLILFHDKSPCGVWPLAFDINDKEPVKSINNQ